MKFTYINKKTFNQILELYPEDIFNRKEIKSKLENMCLKAQYICQKIKVDYTRVIEFGCLLHDIGRVDGVKYHHITGGRRAVNFLKSINELYDFRKIEVLSILDCIKMHRKSFKIDALNPYFPLEAQIVNLANRDFDVKITTSQLFNKILSDSIHYLLEKYPRIDAYTASSNIYDHLKKKYGLRGYGYTNPLFDRLRHPSIADLFQSKLKHRGLFEAEIMEKFIKLRKGVIIYEWEIFKTSNDEHYW